MGDVSGGWVNIFVTQIQIIALCYITPILLFSSDLGCQCGIVEFDPTDEIGLSVVAFEAHIRLGDKGEVIDIRIVDPLPC